MSGGGKMSKITRRFKDHFKRFFKINENDKIKKCEAWGSLNGIFKFVEAQNTTYANASGKELSGLEKMEENINNTANSSNKDRYIKAIDCFKQGCDTILSGSECVSYSVFVNEGGATTTTAVEAPAAVAADEGEEKTSADVAVEAPAAVEGEKDTSGAAVVKGDEAVVAEPTVTEGDDDNVQAPAEVPVAEEDTRGAADDAEAKAAAATTEGEEKKEEKDTLPQSQQPAASVDKSSEGGGRSRRRARPSRRIKSRKSKKGRMTRRKHRAARR